MNKQGISKTDHLELKNVVRTCFRYEDHEYPVRGAPPAIFDAWIQQFVEEITNVDRATWNIFQRWNIINVVLAEGLLTIVKGDNDRLERPPVEATPEAESEETSVKPEAEGEVKPTEVASVSASEKVDIKVPEVASKAGLA